MFVSERMNEANVTVCGHYCKRSIVCVKVEGIYYYSVHLRTVPALLTRARLTATYRACLRSIRACTVTSPNTCHIQATEARPHGCNNRAKNVGERVSTLFPTKFCRLNNEKRTLGVIVDDLSRRLFMAVFVF